MIILLLFACDHYRLYELQNKVKTSAYLAASMLQQIANTRINKQITSFDLARISFASCLNFFHTQTVFAPWPFGIHYTVNFIWVKRINSNSYQYQYSWASTGTWCSSVSSMTRNRENIKTITKAEVVSQHPDLVCDIDGDERVCIECVYKRHYSSLNKNQLELFVIEPTTKTDMDGDSICLFLYRLVITPKPGLFPSTN
ncbi:MAG: hypothetical protein IJT36_09015 [Alphaproteobacteria bacterium]|nr:hypothetical protein [Alphaproteobacteria bacterium]